jgi:hypothetical protein
MLESNNTKRQRTLTMLFTDSGLGLRLLVSSGEATVAVA